MQGTLHVERYEQSAQVFDLACKSACMTCYGKRSFDQERICSEYRDTDEKSYGQQKAIETEI
eukprot:2905002-Pleurochrysis_carterae.AAC.1